jgi:hypothetical protein
MMMNNGFNNMMGTMNMLRSIKGCGNNPKQIVQLMMQRNPQARMLMTQFDNMRQGRSYKDFAMQYLGQNGVDTRELESIARDLGDTQ